jgi:hypothetical protein
MPFSYAIHDRCGLTHGTQPFICWRPVGRDNLRHRHAGILQADQRRQCLPTTFMDFCKRLMAKENSDLSAHTPIVIENL